LFVDRVKITISSGKGGAGCASFRREKFIIKGGPDGGDGGKGGDVYFVANNNTDTLSSFRGKKHLKAKNGAPGSSRNKSGKSGEDLIIIVPPGTQVIDEESKEVLLDLKEAGQKVLFLQGGKGGLGNARFKSSTNQKPTYAQPGLEGITKNVILELKLIADVGLVGFPNVGKSTLISVLSSAKPEIANYEFTTLTPNLGVVSVDEYNSFVMADIPGIISGASNGKGLGLEFLRHIERTKFLLLMLDITNHRTLEKQFSELKKELQNYSNELFDKNFAIAITKIDAKSEDETKKIITDFEKQIEKINKKPEFILPISSVSKMNIQELRFLLFENLRKS